MRAQMEERNNQYEHRPEIVLFEDENGDWRPKIRVARIEFDDERKGTYLKELMFHGRKADAAYAAGVTPGCVQKHLRKDDEFAEAAQFAEELCRDNLLRHHLDLVFNGSERTTYDRQGNVVGTEKVYYPRLIELELKKQDPKYREKQEVDVTHHAGVMVAPSETKSVEDWEARFSQAKDVTPASD